MELTSRLKMARFQTFWIQMRINKPLEESRKTDQTLGTKMAFYYIICEVYNGIHIEVRRVLTNLDESCRIWAALMFGKLKGVFSGSTAILKRNSLEKLDQVDPIFFAKFSSHANIKEDYMRFRFKQPGIWSWALCHSYKNVSWMHICMDEIVNLEMKIETSLGAGL
ncbi:hypothetical protein HanPI659440_Chr03g0120411 [Helianthus annuus]|nr:hypothetical protein HanPI659440_Chr03g0120411 [Helianthus annuus]